MTATPELLGRQIRDKYVMVTGAGGSIGSELCRQIVQCRPRQLPLLELTDVPLVEANPCEGIRNNVWGTLVCAHAARKYGTENFVLVSTDKAVRPTNIMGASKRLAELVLQAFDAQQGDRNGHAGSNGTCYCMVRFGNVLN